MGKKVAGFGHDGLGVAAALASAGVGYHAIGTVVLASPHDGDVGRNAVGGYAHRLDVLIGLGGAELGFGSLDTLLAHLCQYGGQLSVGIGSDYKTDVLLLHHQLALQPLGHAAQNAYAQLLVALLQGAQVVQPFAIMLRQISQYRSVYS